MRNNRLTWVLIVGLVLGMVGCGQETEKPKAEEPKKPPQEDVSEIVIYKSQRYDCQAAGFPEGGNTIHSPPHRTPTYGVVFRSQKEVEDFYIEHFGPMVKEKYPDKDREGIIEIIQTRAHKSKVRGGWEFWYKELSRIDFGKYMAIIAVTSVNSAEWSIQIESITATSKELTVRVRIWRRAGNPCWQGGIHGLADMVVLRKRDLPVTFHVSREE